MLGGVCLCIHVKVKDLELSVQKMNICLLVAFGSVSPELADKNNQNRWNYSKEPLYNP